MMTESNLISQAGASTESTEDFEIPHGAIPHCKLYDRTGQRRRTFEIDAAAKEQFTAENIDAAVRNLLDE